jgi:hypothetical protein
MKNTVEQIDCSYIHNAHIKKLIKVTFWRKKQKHFLFHKYKPNIWSAKRVENLIDNLSLKCIDLSWDLKDFNRTYKYIVETNKIK